MKRLLIITVFLFATTFVNAQDSYKLTVQDLNTDNAEIVGLHLCYFNMPHKEWSLGYSLRYDFITFSNNFTQNLFTNNPDFDSYEYYNVSLGCDFFCKLFWKFYLVTPMYINIGSETLSSSSDGTSINDIFVGVSGDAMFTFIPDNYGITFGCGISGMYTSATYYKSDFGFKFEVGLKF